MASAHLCWPCRALSISDSHSHRTSPGTSHDADQNQRRTDVIALRDRSNILMPQYQSDVGTYKRGLVLSTMSTFCHSPGPHRLFSPTPCCAELSRWIIGCMVRIVIAVLRHRQRAMLSTSSRIAQTTVHGHTACVIGDEGIEGLIGMVAAPPAQGAPTQQWCQTEQVLGPPHTR